MEILDLNNLSIEQVKKLNEISVSIKEEFNDLTENIINSTNKSIAWLLHPLVSRNPYQSELFINICYLLLVKDFLSQTEKNTITVICKSNIQKRILKKFAKSNKIHLVLETRNYDRRSTAKTLIYTFLNIVKKSIRYYSTKSFKRTEKIRNTGRVIIIDTFILQNSINKGKYIDRYYPGLLESLTESEKSRVFWIPAILGRYKAKDLNKIYRNSKENFIFRQDLLLFSDYLKSLFDLISLKFIKKNFFTFHDLNITPLIRYEHRTKRFHNSTFEGLLNFRLVKRLKDKSINIELVIDWNENQPIDKGFIKGFKTFYKDIYVKGYQGYIISTDFNFYIQPTDFEDSKKVIPDEICVIGENLKQRIREFKPNMKVTTVPAFRFQGIFDSSVRFPSENITLLIALPIGEEESIDIITIFSKSLNFIKTYKKLKIIIKPHPLLNINKLRKKLSELWRNDFTINTENFNEVVSQTNLLIGSTSTTLLETLTKGIPVIVIGSQRGITQNPIPKEITRDIWTICYTPEHLAKQIERYIQRVPKEIEENIKLGKYIRSKYFTPVKREGVRDFLKLKN